MTTSVTRSRTAHAPETLQDLVGDVESFFAVHWGEQPHIWRAPSRIEALISEAEIWEEVEQGFLSRPYFTMFNEGVRSAMSDITRSRRVVGRELAGFINSPQIKKDFSEGGTFKFNQAEHWHPRLGPLVKALAPHFQGGLESFVFLSPPGKTAIRAHMDGAHVFVLQVAGTKDWTVGRLDKTSSGASTLYEGEIPAHLRLERTLHPGDILYMPHGCPHYATAHETNSIHVAITVEEPTALDLVNVALAGALRGVTASTNPSLSNLGQLDARVEATRGVVLDLLRGQDPAQLLASAVKLRQNHSL